MAGSKGVVGAALISLRDEGSHNIGERAAVNPNITAGDVVSSSSVAEDTLEDFSPAEQEVGRGVSTNLLFDPAVNPSQSLTLVRYNIE